MEDFGLRLVGAIFLGLFVAILTTRIVRPTPGLSSRVRPYTATSRSILGRLPDQANSVRLDDGVGLIGVFQRLLTPLAEAVLKIVTRTVGGAWDDSATLLKLRQAGLMVDTKEENRVYEWRLRQVIAGIGWGIGAGLAAQLFGLGPAVVLGGFVLGAVIGISRRSALMSRAIEDRRDRMRVELYTINQLLAIYLRTSGSPTLAAQRLVRRGRGVVIDELNEALRLHTRGMSATKAFNRIADSTPEPMAARTYKLLASGSERGADLAKSLLALSEDVRDHQRNDIRRAAVKRQGAMLVPIIGFLAPVMLLFIAAPLPNLIFGSGAF